ncbi:hypothetical protein PINS_up011023 [Pythium insidiosum]|nr:hypothetical protein PINS_up011023 [Pythium insidiosum]
MAQQLCDESLPISNEEQPYYDALKAEFGDSCTEDFYIRVTRAFRNNKKNRMQQTMSEAKRIVEWRKLFQADTVLTRELDQAKIYFDCWPGMLYGEDEEGHLIAVDRLSEIQVEAFQKNFDSIDKLIPHRLQYMERIQWEKAAVSKRLGRRVYKHICIVDLRGLGMKHASRSILNHLKVRTTESYCTGLDSRLSSLCIAHL